MIPEPDWLPNPTPGEILLEESLRRLDLIQTALARALRAPPRRINEIVLGKRAVTTGTDLRLTLFRSAPRLLSRLAGRSRPNGAPPRTGGRPRPHRPAGRVR